MNPSDPRLHAALQAAMSRIRATAASAVDRVELSLGVNASSAISNRERQAFAIAQLELRHKLHDFNKAFGVELEEQISEEIAPRLSSARRLANTDWMSLSLVEDDEVEDKVSSDRIGQAIAHECEWELRDLASYMAALTRTGRAESERNPLRPEILGRALHKALNSVSSERETRRVLAKELTAAMAASMKSCYAEILTDLRSRGVQPIGLSVKTVEGPGNDVPRNTTGYASHTNSGFNTTGPGETLGLPSTSQAAGLTIPSPLTGAAGIKAAHAAHRMPHWNSGNAGLGHRAGTPPSADVQLMSLIRRLAFLASSAGEMDAPGGRGSPSGLNDAGGRAEGLDRMGFGLGGTSGGRAASGFGSASSGSGSGHATDGGGQGGGGFGGGGGGNHFGSGVAGSVFGAGSGGSGGGSQGPGSSSGFGGPSDSSGGAPSAAADTAPQGLNGLMAVNLIRAHREELMQASTGTLDHMVIDVVGSLFDQILSDPKVPPQMARQIARLQLPVLRVALGDVGFFSSRRHPVRRFVNRIASLACAFEEFDEGPGKRFLTLVRELVQEIVQGDFDQMDLYESKLATLEAFIAHQTEEDIEQRGPTTALLDGKENELRIQQRYMQQLKTALAPLTMHDFIRDFLSQVWSQAMLQAIQREGADSVYVHRLKQAGRNLVMSVQPKGTPTQRKTFLMQLPTLMKDLNEGLDKVGWPERAKREFFGKLLPAHAESLKGKPQTELEHNLLVKQLDGILNIGVPRSDEMTRADALPVLTDAVTINPFSKEEAARIGLVEEAAVDWDGEIDINLSAEPEVEAQDSAPPDGSLDIDLDLGMTPSEPPEPSRGAQLMDHIKLGFAYQMHLKAGWQKVRLGYVSPGRAFFVFTHGKRHQETISMTARMLARMCETERLRAFENAYLIERATARARKQLSALGTTAAVQRAATAHKH